MKRSIAGTSGLTAVIMILVSGVLFLVLQVTMGVEQPHAPGARTWENVVGYIFLLTSAGAILSLAVSVVAMAFNKIFRGADAASPTRNLR
jgi:hypothetical protein